MSTNEVTASGIGRFRKSRCRTGANHRTLHTGTSSRVYDCWPSTGHGRSAEPPSPKCSQRPCPASTVRNFWLLCGGRGMLGRVTPRLLGTHGAIGRSSATLSSEKMQMPAFKHIVLPQFEGRRYVIPVALTIFYLCNHTIAQEESVTIADIERACNLRQERAQSLKLEWTERRIRPKRSWTRASQTGSDRLGSRKNTAGSPGFAR